MHNWERLLKAEGWQSEHPDTAGDDESATMEESAEHNSRATAVAACRKQAWVER